MPRSSRSSQRKEEAETPTTTTSSRRTQVLPVVPVRELVLFPGMVVPLLLGREKTIRAVHQALHRDSTVFAVTQKDSLVDDPQPDDLYQVGVTAEITQMTYMPDGTIRVTLEACERARVLQLAQRDPFLCARVAILRTKPAAGARVEAMMRGVVDAFDEVVQNQGVRPSEKTIPPEVLMNVVSIDDPSELADYIASLLPIRTEVKQDLLETLDAAERLEKLYMRLQRELEIIEVHRSIRNRVEKEMGDAQKEFILREELKAIQEELGEHEAGVSDTDRYRSLIEEAGMPDEVKERALSELGRLDRMPYAAPEGVVIRSYLDWLVALPWSKRTEDVLDLEKAARILDEDHYGLEKVKERVVEFLAVRKLTRDHKGPILCFVGPPGVGKTSIGKSIARALGRRFHRLSLGGVRDEAEIRGHRRTYVGALPGRIIQGIRTAGTRNPVFMLDEIDKLGADFRGDPSAALLEALDPEQNTAFSDHYLEVPFDLSEVMFILTANLLDTVPPALRDRMEIIQFSGYIEDEKVEIARRFLVPKQLKENGLSADVLCFDESAVRLLIREYTREAGVRNLEREIASICRKVARKVASKSDSYVGTQDSGTGAQARPPVHVVRDSDVRSYLGVPRFSYGRAETGSEPGIATGLVYTECGGDIVSVEVALMPGEKGNLILTGQLGDVMKESAQAALTYVRSRAESLGVDPQFYSKTDIHVHVPAGAVPKDGPSAGITIAAAIASALSKKPVRSDVAMTGEITLRGRILPVGGVKEKVLAAHRAGIRTVVLPKENESALEEIPPDVLRQITLHLVSHADEALSIALGV
ncbi:MAG: endopeptidase La [Armatimonadota bacterium]|nr:endopeptidase La [Armatimonadota bacterium]